MAKKKQGVKLGFLLLGGADSASDTLSKQGEISAEKLSNIVIEPLSEKWWWCGPFGNTQSSFKENQELNTIFAPEKENGYKNWKKVDGNQIDFATLTNYNDRGVNYAKTTIESNEDEEVTLYLYVDYWAKVWVNEQLVLTVDKSHGSPQDAIIFKATLKKGQNSIFLKIHSGSNGNNFSLKQIKGLKK